MNFLIIIWDWLDGNKTLLGMVILYFVGKEGNLLGSAFIEQWAQYLGDLLVGGGILHKMVKGTSNTGK